MLTPKEGGEDSSRRVDSGTWKRRKVEYLAQRVIVKFKVDNEGEEGGEAALKVACDAVCEQLPGGRVLRRPSRTARAVMGVKQGESVTKLAREISKRDDVVYAEPDLIDHAAIVPNDTRYTDQWSHGVVDSENAWNLETGDPSVIVGIIDSGISMSGGVPDHPDLSGSNIVLGTDFVDGGTPRDTNGHGTHVAGIAAGTGNNAAGVAGMAWNCTLYVCRTLDGGGNGSSADFADAVEEITDFALANGKKAVINYSAGGGDNLTKQDAAQYASDNGMLLCAATGNDFASPVIFPAAYSTTISGVVAVGSTTTTDTVSQFSNVGPEVTVVAPGGEIAGGAVPPGEAILSAFPTYPVGISGGPNFAGLVGTSMATPLVSGLAALIWSRHPTHTNQKVKDCLIDTAVKLGAGNFNNSWGFGRVDAHQALKCGGLVIPPSVLPWTCPPSWLNPPCWTSQITICHPTRVLDLCMTSRVGPCPTPLPVLCPTSRVAPDCRSEIDACPSRFDPGCFEPASKLTGGCGGGIASRVLSCDSRLDNCPSALNPDCGPGGTNSKVVVCEPPGGGGIESNIVCPSVVDGCPSSLGCGPTIVVQPGPEYRRPFEYRRPVDYRQPRVRRDLVRSEDTDRWEDADGRWYYVDHDGETRLWSGSEGRE